MTRDDHVETAADTATPRKVDVYRRSEANLRRLKEKLPEDAVVNLAREVILRVASRSSAGDAAPYVASDEELDDLCNALISKDENAAASIVTGLRASGIKAEDIYLKQLGAAARLLGERWEKDELSFVEVTVGTGRMFAIMRSMRALFEPRVIARDKAATFASVPGEDHTLGVHMAADLFRKEGWDIALKVGLDHDQLVAEIEKSPNGIVGLSISGEHSIDALSRLVVALHICCPNAIILVSGSNIEAVRPTLTLLGVDGIAATIEDAVQQLEKL
ncbi:B12-binding domain-containing protein [Tateyamaria sp. Alg231-49]|uniref:cobalamin B12-binding domain-containing protein n=1 Tax=Tateyamaria sp. Alg231-49 TaxID=1922219 RepID=UPI000D54C5B6|nr:cobalamin-dependent protein [Tateyamaria sp. Alg231-49]